MRIGFIGLGVMGGPMAGHLLDGGAEVTVWNRTSEKSKPLTSRGAKVAESIPDLAQECDVVISCVSKSEDVEAVIRSALTSAKPGTLFIDHSTIAPAAVTQLVQIVKESGCRFVDAPITGGSMGAQRGQLTIFFGGDEADVEEAISLTRPYTKSGARVGASGAGQMMKMANQIAVAGSVIGLCESINFAQKAGLNLAQAVEMIGSGAGGSWAFLNYGPKILNSDWTPGFTIDNQLKDFGYCHDAAKTIDANIPGTTALQQLLKEMQDRGQGNLTTVALFQHLQEMDAGAD